MAVKIGHASGSEKGTITGAAGDQTGREVCTRTWYLHGKGWVLIRCKDPNMRPYIAEGMEKACANNLIGYDQHQNQTLWNLAKAVGFDPAAVKKKCETDCARLVRLCAQYACEKVGNGKTIPDFYTATEAATLKKTGLFEVLISSKYTKQDDYLLRGDILVTKRKGHTVVVLSNGAKADPGSAPSASTGTPVLREGDTGDAVREMQQLLIKAGCDLEKYGADGSFGGVTLKALKAYQTAHALDPDGICGPLTWAALKAGTGKAPANTGSSAKPEINMPTLHKGDTGETVREMQQLLNKAGCALDPDGSFGPETHKAVKAFQTAHALDPDGICGPLTWAALKACEAL